MQRDTPQTMRPTLTPTFAHVPPGPVAGPLQLLPINAAVVSVHTADGAHVGSLKLVGGVDGHCGGVDGEQLQGACQRAGWRVGEGGGEWGCHGFRWYCSF